MDDGHSEEGGDLIGEVLILKAHIYRLSIRQRVLELRVKETAAMINAKVLNLEMESRSHLQTISQLKREIYYLKNNPECSCKCRLVEESPVSNSDGTHFQEHIFPLEQQCCDISSLGESFQVVRGQSQELVQSEDITGNSYTLHKTSYNKTLFKGEDICAHYVSSMRFIHDIGEGFNGTVSMVEVEGVPFIAKRPRVTASSATLSDISRHVNFNTECSLLARLHHPNIIQYIGMYSDPNDLALILEYMPVDLDKLLSSCQNHFPISLHLSVLLDVSLGMRYLHSRDIVHCDLTPDNILLSSALDAKISDLGCAKIIGSRDTEGYPQTTLPHFWTYMPPEVFEANFLYTEKLDVFSFGVLSLFVATQTLPKRYMGSDVSQAAKDRKEVEIERHLSAFNMVEKDHCIISLIEKCLQDEATDRPTSIDVTRCVRFWAKVHPKQIEDVVLVNNQLQNQLMTNSSRIAASLATDKDSLLS